jgi:hypothetical protein
MRRRAEHSGTERGQHEYCDQRSFHDTFLASEWR